MQVQYSSASRSSSEEKVTLDGSGQGVCASGVTFIPILTPDFVGVHWSREGGKGELVCWARFVLTKQKTSFLNQHYSVIKQNITRAYFSFFSSSLSSCRLSILFPITEPSSGSTDGGVDGLLNGVDVKQVFGLECGRSPLTGVGFILRDGPDALKEEQSACQPNLSIQIGR